MFKLRSYCYRYGYVDSPRSQLFGVVSAEGGQTGWSATGGVYVGYVLIYPLPWPSLFHYTLCIQTLYKSSLRY